MLQPEQEIQTPEKEPMQIVPIKRIDCMLLHGPASPLDRQEAEQRIRAVLEAAGLGATPEESRGTAERHQDFIAFIAGDWRLSVYLSPSPLSRETLAQALGQPYTRTIFPQAEETVARHGSFTWISLEKAGHNGKTESEPFTDSREALPAMSLVALLARELMAAHPALAVYWAPSDHLLPPSLFTSLTADRQLILLNIRPQYFTGAAGTGQNAPMGMIAYGTQHLIGRLLVIEPAAIPPGELHGLAAAVIMEILGRGQLPQSAERIAVSGSHWHAEINPAGNERMLGMQTLHLRPIQAAHASQGTPVAGIPPFPEAPGADSDGAPDIADLPPEVREEIFEQRRRRSYEQSNEAITNFKNTAMNIAAGAIGLVMFFGFMSSFMPKTVSPGSLGGPVAENEVTAKNRKAERNTERRAEGSNAERSERGPVVNETRYSEEEVPRDEADMDEEKEETDQDLLYDEEQELKKGSRERAKGESRRAAKKDEDSEVEDDDLMTD